MTLKEEVIERARALGFVRVGVARAEPLDREGAALRDWISNGRHGDMQYMADTAAVRADPTHASMLLSARSVIVLVAPYRGTQEPFGPSPGRVAKYAAGRDYHNVLYRRVGKLTRWLRELGHEARGSVDSMPVLERTWAQRAGVGFIGKNCCLIVPGVGSHVFLASVITSAELEPDEPMAERCGQCTLCLDVCPTQAFEAPRTMDARRCISYLTIEHRGAIEESLRPAMGEWVFGCDACQDVCPYNRTSPPSDTVTAPFAPDERWERHDAAAVLGMDDATFQAYAHGSPIQRAGREGFARNLSIMLGNHGERRHLPILRDTAHHDPSPIVRDAAAWALERIE